MRWLGKGLAVPYWSRLEAFELSSCSTQRYPLPATRSKLPTPCSVLPAPSFPAPGFLLFPGIGLSGYLRGLAWVWVVSHDVIEDGAESTSAPVEQHGGSLALG